MTEKAPKPLGQRAYGSIPHLPGSRRGPADRGLADEQASLLTNKTRDKHDVVIVQEKLDGSNVAVAKIGGEIVSLIRAGYTAEGSHWTQHHHFARWVDSQKDRFDRLLNEGERCVGEWLMEAHGTRYQLPHEPFVIFDIMQKNERLTYPKVKVRCWKEGFTTPQVLHVGGALSIAEAVTLLDPSGHGAIDPVEGAVWRMERKGVVDFLGKYVRPDKVDGKFLETITGGEPIYNWKP